MSRELSTEEVKANFIGHIKQSIEYWDNQPGSQKTNLEGLAFSILTAIDGVSGLPGFILAPDPHPGDKKYDIDNEDNYYPQNNLSSVNCDISGNLHELIYK